MRTPRPVTTAIATVAFALAGLTLLAPHDAFARTSAAERLAENAYAALTAGGPVTLPATGELEVGLSVNRPNG